MRNNVIFLHIPKNGGSTLTPILNRNFLKNEIFNIEVIDYRRSNIYEFENMSIVAKSKIRLITGHMSFGIHKHLKGRSEYITFLREPIERALSYYYFVKRNPKHERYDVIFKNNLSFHEFILKYEEFGLVNEQIRMISGIQGTSENMLKIAIRNSKQNFSFIGFQDRFDESLIILKKIFNWKVPYYRRRNTTLNRPNIKMVKKETIELFNELNKEDILFYNLMKENFEEKLNAISNVNFKLKKIRFYSKLYSSTKLKIIKKKISMIIKINEI